MLSRMIRKVFGVSEKAVPEKKTAKKSSKSAAKKPTSPKNAMSKSRVAKRPAPTGKKNLPKPKKEAPVAAKPVILPHPAELKIAPQVEGKLRFTDLALHKEVLFGVQAAGFEYCTPIQSLALPVLLGKRDLAARAQTGTGKTAAFLLASFTELLNHPLAERKANAPRILVLAPTRELAAQIHKDAEQLGVYTGLSKEVVFGGMDHEKQRRALNKDLDLLVGTPGRVIDYCQSGDLDLSKVEILVIDEADRMLDMGFIPDVKRIVSRLPKRGDRQTLLFSATLDESILRLSSGWLADPAVVESEPEKLVSENIRQEFYSVLRDEKLALLLYLLQHETYDRVMIFGNRKDVNLRLQFDLARYGFDVPVLSGDIAQEKRIKILEKFRTGEEKIVIATDVAARGIHVDDVSMVINYDLPERAEDYVHRIGRTGRAGHTGIAVSFLCEYGAYYLPAIEEMLKVQFHSTLPSEEMLQLPPEVPGTKHHFEEVRHHSGGRSGRPRMGARRH